MELFSKRNTESEKINNEQNMKIRIWNILDEIYFRGIDSFSPITFLNSYDLFKEIWQEIFILPTDEIPELQKVFQNEFKKKFFKSDWKKIFDIIELILQEDQINRPRIKEKCDQVFEREDITYRIINNSIVKIMDKVEKDEIEVVIKSNISSVKEHIKRALELYSDRDNPDYRNSIKESISAVESICILITNDKKATLGKALKSITNKGYIHPALIKGFDKIYGYTSDENGIRHCLHDSKGQINDEDARFMLVACSAFINYLIVIAEKVGISLNI